MYTFTSLIWSHLGDPWSEPIRQPSRSTSRADPPAEPIHQLSRSISRANPPAEPIRQLSQLICQPSRADTSAELIPQPSRSPS